MKVMDKAIMFVCSMLSTAMVYSLIELLRTSKGEHAIGAISLLCAVIYIAATYPKHRKDYT